MHLKSSLNERMSWILSRNARTKACTRFPIDNIFSPAFDWRKIIYKVVKRYTSSINWGFDINHEVGSCPNQFITVSVVFSNKLFRGKNWRQFQSSDEKTEVCNTKSNWLVVCYKFLSDISSPRPRHIVYRKCSILIQLQPHWVSLTFITYCKILCLIVGSDWMTINHTEDCAKFQSFGLLKLYSLDTKFWFLRLRFSQLDFTTGV